MSHTCSKQPPDATLHTEEHEQPRLTTADTPIVFCPWCGRRIHQSTVKQIAQANEGRIVTAKEALRLFGYSPHTRIHDTALVYHLRHVKGRGVSGDPYRYEIYT